MKSLRYLVLLVLLLAALLVPTRALAQDHTGDEFVFGGSYSLSNGETLDGNLFIFGGTAVLDEGSRVNGDIMLAGGSLDASGRVDGNITTTGGLVNLRSTAVVTGDVSLMATNFQREDGATVDGQVRTGARGPFQVTIPGGVRVPAVQVDFNPFWDTLWMFFTSFLWAALAILVVLFLERPTGRVAQAVLAQPLITGGVGALTMVVAVPVLILTAITLILLPMTLLILMALVVAWGFGLIALGTEAGKRISAFLKQNWALPVEAGVGTFLLTLVSESISKVIPCVGWLAPAIVGALGLGAVLLTRFGSAAYPPVVPLSSASTPPPYVPVLNSEPPPPVPEPQQETPGDSMPPPETPV